MLRFNNFDDFIHSTLLDKMLDTDKERACVALMNTRGEVIVPRKTLREGKKAHGVSFPSPSDIAAFSSKNKGYTNIILVHSHPTGDTEKDVQPSVLDVTTTERFIREFKKYGLQLSDHLIVSRLGVSSFVKYGLL